MVAECPTGRRPGLREEQTYLLGGGCGNLIPVQQVEELSQGGRAHGTGAAQGEKTNVRVRPLTVVFIGPREQVHAQEQ